MSGSEMGNREPFTVDLHNMRLDYAATAADGTPLYNNPLQPNASPTFHPSTAVTVAPININGGGTGGESVAVTRAHVGREGEDLAALLLHRPTSLREGEDIVALATSIVSLGDKGKFPFQLMLSL